MEYHDLEKWQDKDLVRRSGSAGPYAELMRRNTEALNKNAKNSGRQSDLILVITFLMFFVALMQLVVAIQSLPFNFYIIGGLTLIVLIALYYFMKDIFKWFEDKNLDND